MRDLGAAPANLHPQIDLGLLRCFYDCSVSYEYFVLLPKRIWLCRYIVVNCARIGICAESDFGLQDEFSSLCSFSFNGVQPLKIAEDSDWEDAVSRLYSVDDYGETSVAKSSRTSLKSDCVAEYPGVVLGLPVAAPSVPVKFQVSVATSNRFENIKTKHVSAINENHSKLPRANYRKQTSELVSMLDKATGNMLMPRSSRSKAAHKNKQIRPNSRNVVLLRAVCLIRQIQCDELVGQPCFFSFSRGAYVLT